MEMLIPGMLFSVGIVALIWGGDKFVGSASWMAERTGVPKFIVGATVVSLATTLPELIVSIMATIDGSVDLAVGNAVGSVSANIGLIMGISLLLLPGKIEDDAFWKKGLLMILATGFLGAFVIDGRLGFPESLLMLALMAYFVRLNLNSMKKAELPSGKGSLWGKRPSVWRGFCRLADFALGLGGILLGADLLVDNGARLARMMGVPEALIGLTLVAVGTSLPELITTLTAVAKGESALSVGNIIGANIIDITLILAGCAFVSGGRLEISERTAAVDIPITLLLMLVAVIPTFRGRKFRRWQGGALLVLYVGYVAWMTISM